MSGSPATQWRRGSCIPPTPTRDSRCPTRHMHDGPPTPIIRSRHIPLRSQVMGRTSAHHRQPEQPQPRAFLRALRDSTWCASHATRSYEHGAGPTHQPMMHLIYLLLSTATSRKRLVVV